MERNLKVKGPEELKLPRSRSHNLNPKEVAAMVTSTTIHAKNPPQISVRTLIESKMNDWRQHQLEVIAQMRILHQAVARVNIKSVLAKLADTLEVDGRRVMQTAVETLGLIATCDDLSGIDEASLTFEQHHKTICGTTRLAWRSCRGEALVLGENEENLLSDQLNTVVMQLRENLKLFEVAAGPEQTDPPVEDSFSAWRESQQNVEVSS